MMPFDLTENQNKSESVLFVGLVCIDNSFVVEKYPEEDSDQPASEAFKARGGNAANNCTVLAQIYFPWYITKAYIWKSIQVCCQRF